MSKEKKDILELADKLASLLADHYDFETPLEKALLDWERARGKFFLPHDVCFAWQFRRAPGEGYSFMTEEEIEQWKEKNKNETFFALFSDFFYKRR